MTQVTSMTIGNSIVEIASYEIGSAKHVRAIIECTELAETGTRELFNLFLNKNPHADSQGIKADAIRHLASVGCYPLLTKKDGNLYGPKSISDKVKQGRYVLDAWGSRCLNFAFALERLIERNMPSGTKRSKSATAEPKTITTTKISAKAEKSETAEPKTITTTKIVNQPVESVRSQLAALLAKALELSVEHSELSEVIKHCMTLLPKV